MKHALIIRRDGTQYFIHGHSSVIYARYAQDDNAIGMRWLS